MDTQSELFEDRGLEFDSILDLKSTIKHVAISTYIGGLGGVFWASCTGANPYSRGAMMALNWCTMSIPFFLLRDGIIQTKYSEKERNLEKSFPVEYCNYPVETFRDKCTSQWWASVEAGFLQGLGVGYLWGGPAAMLPVGLVHSAAAGLFQTGYNKIDTWRLRKAIDLYSGKNADAVLPSAIKDRNYMWNLNQATVEKVDFDTPRQFAIDNKGIDPVKILFDWIADWMDDSSFLKEKEWLRNATDLEYRRKQIYKIAILQEQIGEMKSQLSMRKRVE